MVDEPTGGLGFDELRKKFLDDSGYFKHQKFEAKLEEPKPQEFNIPIKTKDSTIKIRFRPWNHGELMKLTKLPFYPKIVAKEKLTDEENEVFKIAKEEMVNIVALDPNAWAEMVAGHPNMVEPVFGVIMSVSGIDDTFYGELNDFLSSDIGFAYGLVWFQMLHMLPSEVSKVSESDYQAVSLWMNKWAERRK